MLVRIRIRSEGWWLGAVHTLLTWLPTDRRGIARPASTIPDHRERRRHRLNSPVTLYWRDSGSHDWRVQCRAVDMSRLGVMVVAKKAIAVGSVVYVYVNGFHGAATVRHCTRRRFTFLIGFEFDGPLVRWQ